jgi:hypothetical protein
MSIEGTPDGQEVVPETPAVLPKTMRPPWLERMLAADDLERFLGVPPGGHRDPWSIGGVQPRWPEQREPPPDLDQGKVIGEYTINLETGAITDYVSHIDPPKKDDAVE